MLLLAQTVAPVISQDTPISLGLVLGLAGGFVALITLAAAVGALFWRVARLEKDLDEERRRNETRDTKATATAQEVAVVTGALGRIEKSLEGLGADLRAFILPGRPTKESA